MFSNVFHVIQGILRAESISIDTQLLPIVDFENYYMGEIHSLKDFPAKSNSWTNYFLQLSPYELDDVYKNYDYAGHLLKEFLTKKEQSVVESYRDNPTKLEFHPLKQIFETHLEKGLADYPCLQEMIDQFDTFKTSFMKRYVLDGKDL